MMMRLMTIWLILGVSAAIPLQGADLQPKSEKAGRLFTNVIRDEYQDVTIFVTPDTIFIGDRPGGFHFEDLMLGDWVFVEGFYTGPTEFIAAFVHFRAPPGGHNHHDPMTEHLAGSVNQIDYQNGIFHIFRNCHQGEFMFVAVPPDTPVRQAMHEQPLQDIEFADLHPGDPVMINGEFNGEDFFAEYIIRSDDWLPPPPGSNSTTYDLYGFIDAVFMGEHQALKVFVQTLTGDPNHHTYSYQVGPMGANCDFPWGALNIPPGALTENRTITVSGDFMFLWTLRNVYSFEPRTEFEVPIQLELRYFNLGNIDPDNVILTYFNEDTGQWEYSGEMVHHPEAHCFRGEILHFSRYSLSVNGRPIEQVLEEH